MDRPVHLRHAAKGIGILHPRIVCPVLLLSGESDPFADTGLLGHWGLRLEAPEETGPKQLTLASRDVLVASPGRLSGVCEIGDFRLVAHCRLGQGKATIIADADFLNVEQLDGPTDRNLDALLAELAALEP